MSTPRRFVQRSRDLVQSTAAWSLSRLPHRLQLLLQRDLRASARWRLLRRTRGLRRRALQQRGLRRRIMLRLVRDVEKLFAPPVTQPDPSRAPQPVPGDGRSVVISLSQQALWAFEGQRVVVGTYVSTGKPEFETPAGLFSVNLKLDVESMGGFAKGKEFFYVPDVPYVMYFTEHDHALHGTYWHEKFGTPMSHGCVNLPIPVAEWLYGWAPMEMPVLVVA